VVPPQTLIGKLQRNQSHALGLWIFTVYCPACWVLINMIFFLVCLTGAVVG